MGAQVIQFSISRCPYFYGQLTLRLEKHTGAAIVHSLMQITQSKEASGKR